MHRYEVLPGLVLVLNFPVNPDHHSHFDPLPPPLQRYSTTTQPPSNTGTFLLPITDAQPPSSLPKYIPASSDTILSRSRQPTPSVTIDTNPIVTSGAASELVFPDPVSHSQILPAEALLNGTLDGTPLQVVGPDDDSALGPPGWPLYVPSPELLHHLVETFFDSQPHAARLLHRSSFMEALAAPPSSPQFPIPALLHAICAMASFYTAVIDSPPLPNLADIQSEDMFPQFWYKISSEQSFGDIHALWANITALKANEQGDRTLQVVQSKVILSWYYYAMGSIVNVWITNGKAARAALPMGLNVASNFSGLARHGGNQTASILPPAKSVSEGEERRNMLWVIYLTERLQSAETSWAMLLDDDDISQYLPLPDNLWNEGTEYPLNLRQRLASPNALFYHPPDLTSPFSLLVKSVSILSKVKTFNIRFRNKYADTEYMKDPRSCPEFGELDEMIMKFIAAWPEGYETTGTTNPTLYLASLMPSVATILLHDPHVDFNSSTCPSKKKMLDAVDVIMASIYQLSSAPHDVILLDHYSSFCWVMAGMTLVRVLKAKLESKSHIEAIKINAEIEIVKHILAQLGEKTTIGRRQLKILMKFFDSEVGVHDPSVQKILGPPSKDNKTMTELLRRDERPSQSPSPSYLWENAQQWKS
ncbi:hypothetical protein FRB93_008789 [Tulasnella sp. JGI-2019a]|nr:hypothetical protein FRB93_008789 [Tulasnella sp. JGI-2019a]